MDFAHMAKRVGQFAVDHSPQILTAVGVVGTVTTAYLTGKAAWRVATEVATIEQDLSEEPPDILRWRINVVRDEKLWQEFVPAITVGCTTIVCIIAANHVSGKRAAALAAVVGITEKAADEYRDKVREKFGDRKEEQVRDEIQQDRVSERYHPGVEVFGLPEGHLAYDKYSDRFFRSTVEDIKKAQNDFNYALISDGYASLNEFYGKLGIPTIGTGDIVGWNDAVKLELLISTTLTNTDAPCIAIDFRDEPFPEYGRTFRRG